MSSICMSWLRVEASFGSGATTGLDPSISFSRLSLSKIRKDLSQRELYFFASLVLFIRCLLLWSRFLTAHLTVLMEDPSVRHTEFSLGTITSQRRI